MASLDLGTLKIAIGVDNTEANKQIGETEEQVKKAGSGIGDTVKGIGKGIATATTAIVGFTTTVVAGVWKMATQTADAAGEIYDASQRMGISAESVQELGYAASQSGVDMETLEQAAKNLQKSGSDLNLEQALTQIAGITDESERAAAAQELFGKAAYDLTPLLNEGVTGIDALKQEAVDIGAVMSNDAVAGAESFGDSLEKLKASFTGFQNEVMSALLPSMGNILEGLTGIITGADGAEEKLSTGINNFVNMLLQSIPKILQVAQTIIPTLIKGIVDNLPTLIKTAITIILQLVNEIINMLPTILEAGIQILLAIINGIAEALPELIPTIVNVLLTMVQIIIDNLPLIIDAAIQIILALVKGLLEAIPSIIDAIPEIIDSIITTLIDAIPLIIDAGIQLITALVENLPAIISSIVKAIPKIITSILDKIDTLIPMLIDAGIQLFIALVENLPTIIIEIVKAIPQIITGIVNAFGSFFSKMAETGLNLIKGIWQGISDAATWLWNKVKGWCNNLVDKIKEFFGIHSPSTVFASFGENMTQGLANGLTDTADLAIDAMGDIAREVENAFNPSLDMPSIDASLYGSSNSTSSQLAKATQSSNPAYSGNQNNSITQNITLSAKALTPYEQQIQVRRLSKELAEAFA